MNKKTAFWVVAVPIGAMIGSAFLLTGIFGPSDDGLNCKRDGIKSDCEIRQTRFFGLIGNSSFSVPESSIHGAKAVCTSAKVGGHGSPSCAVYLMLEGRREYPVLSYALSSQADAAADKLNAYFGDTSARSVEIKEDVLTPILIFGIGPVVFVSILFICIRSWKSRHSPFSVPMQA